MGQQPRHIDAADYYSEKYVRRYFDKENWVGKTVDIKECEICHKAPNIIVLDAEYEGIGGRRCYKGKFHRVQIYCEIVKQLCKYNIYTPLEGPTPDHVMYFWNHHGSIWLKTKVQLNTNRPYGY